MLIQMATKLRALFFLVFLLGQSTASASAVGAPSSATKGFRVTYTFTEVSGGKTLSTQKYTLAMTLGHHTTKLKQSSKVPTEQPAGSNKKSPDQWVSMDIEGQLNDNSNGAGPLTLSSKINRSTNDITTKLELESTVTPGKSVNLGQLDVPNSTHHLNVEVLVESNS